jgi:hypothetical protein
MARKTGITTQALFSQAAKHARLDKYIAQGSRRAVLRSTKAAQDAKARAVKQHYNLGKTQFRGINAIKRRFRTKLITRGRMVDATERLVAPAGIPLRDYGARFTKRGVTYSITKGKKHFLPSGFRNVALGGSHVFRRARGSDGRLVNRNPIEKRFGPGLPYLMQNREVSYQGRQHFQRRVAKEIDKEETRAFKRAGLR